MIERVRERIYWRAGLVFLAAAPLAAWLVRDAALPPAVPRLMAIVGFFSLPLTFLIDMLLARILHPGTRLRFWIVHPKAESRATSDADVAGSIETVAGRLKALGFRSWPPAPTPEGAMQLPFAREKRSLIQSFLDHAFAGRALVTPRAGGAEMAVDVTMLDTLVLETGELARLQGLADHLSLKEPAFTYETVALTLYCGLNLAFLTVVAAALATFVPLAAALVASLALTAVGLVGAALLLMLRDRAHAFGWRLALPGFLLPAVSLAPLLPH